MRLIGKECEMGKIAQIVLCIAVIAAISSSRNARAAVWYVDVDNVGIEDGTSWATAFNSIQEGVDAAANGDDIWVAEGTYTSATDPVVIMKTGVDLHGGFAGTETLREERDWTAHVTTIDGQDIRRCLLGANDATLSGFTVTQGYVTGNPAQGGGMLNDTVSPTIEDCIFQANRAISTTVGFPGGSARGGAIACVDDATPTLIRCTFASNLAQGGEGGDDYYGGGTGGVGSGGAFYASGVLPSLTNCAFTSNFAKGGNGGDGYLWGGGAGGGGTGGVGSGGALYFSGGLPLLADCAFTSNLANGGNGGNAYSLGGMGGVGLGGALYFSDGSPSLTNCTFTSNSGKGGNGGNDHEGSEADGGVGSGGVLYSSGSAISGTGCTFDGNWVLSGQPWNTALTGEIMAGTGEPTPADVDNDGFPDILEAVYGLSVASVDADLRAWIDTPSSDAYFRTGPITVSGPRSSNLVTKVVLSTDSGTTWDKTATLSAGRWSYALTPGAIGVQNVMMKAYNEFGGVASCGSVQFYYYPDYPGSVISSPKPDAHISGVVTVQGTVQQGYFGLKDYVLDWHDGVDLEAVGGWTMLATGTSEIIGGTIGTWDTGAVGDGDYVIRLTVTDAPEIYTSRTYIVVRVDHDTPPPAAPSSVSIAGWGVPTVTRSNYRMNAFGLAESGTIVAEAKLVDESGSVLADVTPDVVIHRNGLIGGSVSLPALSVSKVGLRLKVKDAAGNVSGSTSSNLLWVDNVAPSAPQIFYPMANGRVSLDVVDVSGMTIDTGASGAPPEGIAGPFFQEFSTDNVTWYWASGSDFWSYLWTPPAEGDYTLYVRFYDRLGNISSPVSRAVTVNAAYPSARISSPTQGQIVFPNTAVEIVGTANDSSDFLMYKVQYAPGAAPATGWINLTSNIYVPVVNNLMTTWDTTGLTIGTYTLRLLVMDELANNVLFDRIVTVECDSDIDLPMITLIGNAIQTLECGGNYNDAGAMATDDCDGDLTAFIVVGGDTVETASVGTYIITYNVSDTATNAAVEVTRTVNVVDTTTPVIILLGDATVDVECGATYSDAGATAADACSGDLTTSIVITNPVNTAVIGSYTVRYNVSDAASNAAVEVTRTVNVTDTTAPVITLLGNSPISVECGSTYTDASATAVDGCATSITASIVTVNPVNTALVGTYTVTYNVTDAAGNAAGQVTRTVNVIDTILPVITRIGPASVTINCGAVYNDAGATATDACDGDLRSAIDVSNPVNTTSPGIYTVRYDVTDNAGNVATAATRTVTVSLCDEGNAFSGVVIDDRTEQLLSNVVVTLHLPQDTEILNTWTTGADGTFVFIVDDPYQQYDLQFEKTGYEPLWLSGLLPSRTLMPRMRQQTVVPIPDNVTVLVSAGQVILRWDAPLGGDIAGYYVYRDGEKITSSPVTEASYADRTVTPGATYTYQVSAINSSGTESLLSSPVTVTITLGLWIPQVSGAPGTEVYTTLNITNARDIEATTSAGFTIQLEYDPDVIAGITAEAGVILRELNTAITDEGNGLLTLSALNPGAPLQLTGEGKLFDLHITLLAGAELGCSTLKTPLLDFFDTNGNRIPAALIGNTEVCAGDAQLLGDLDGDELITAGDAVLSMLISSRQITPTEYQRIVGDMNGDGRLDAADTVLIHRLASNWRMNPLEDETVLADLLAGLATMVSLPEVEACPGTQVTLGLDVGPLAGLAGADFVIAQDALLLAGDGAAQFPGLPERFGRIVNQQPRGFRVTIASPDALGVNSLEAPMLTVTFTVSPEATPGMLLPVTIANASLKGQYGEDFDWYTTVTLVSGVVRVIGDAEGEGEGEPEEGEPVEGEPEGEAMSLEDIATSLLEQFEDADTNGNGQLSYEEVLAFMPNLDEEQFNALDTDRDGFLAYYELEDYLGIEDDDDDCGCCKSTDDTKVDIRRYIGDWLLVGLSLLVLISLANRQKR